jgi:hypothetical protein
MKNIKSLPQEFQNIFAQLKAEQDAENAIDGTQAKASKEDIREERNLFNADVEKVDENDENEIDMAFVSPSMRAVFK